MGKTTRMATDKLSEMARTLPVGVDPQSVRRRVEAVEHLLERALTIPGFNRAVGLDVLLGAIPVGGSFIGAIMGFYMIWEARNLKMPGHALARMTGNVAFDWLLGLIPIVGIVPDFFFRSNTRNLRIIRRFLDKHHPGTVTVQHKR